MNAEFAILDFIREHIACGVLDFLMPKITFLGNAGLVWIVIAVVLLCQKQHRLTGMQMAAGLLLGVLIGNLLIKNLVLRERPCWIREDIDLLIAVPKDYSFPSGHSMSSFCMALILCRKGWKTGVPACLLAALIAFSRLYLYVHFPTDVLGGILLGSAIAVGVVLVTEHFFKKTETSP